MNSFEKLFKEEKYKKQRRELIMKKIALKDRCDETNLLPIKKDNIITTILKWLLFDVFIILFALFALVTFPYAFYSQKSHSTLLDRVLHCYFSFDIMPQLPKLNQNL